ncbi:hypothetical protein TH66_11055 [Carbonactinospora thermoautotrophica]|uniref:RNase H type-1 domain-containing protein n=2 Tax=Carbonactinospora thermoautotrophica TaxID=1469144 RepID=A0A132MX41_9ACTN|nr:RNase H family protein [Carbonactinospora thermoautotrophica]KWX02270.1 hypothetical protein LI90_3313 [Carbonactinospora thermoautotrophica]KWX03442.1 hypothetical protein TH66_11055 [Carbonactinospora thermoautotrophica]KWX06560.1 hypothetical protein TR74_21650 [Carbonactinospora thermoautotrophica]
MKRGESVRRRPKWFNFHHKETLEGFTLADQGPIVVATDAATQNGRVGYAFVTTAGRFGLGAFPHPERIVGPAQTLVAELRTVNVAIESDGNHPFIILCDSQDAVEYLRAWRRGNLIYPDGYTLYRKNGRTPTLVKLSRKLASNPRRYKVEWVKGHAGHPLNEVADSMAKLALRTLNGYFSWEEAIGLARRYAHRTLSEVARAK